MSFSDPFPSSLSNYRKSWSSLDNAMARFKFDDPVAFYAQGSSHLYDPDPGRPEFHESQYVAYEWETEQHPTLPLRIPLAETPPGPPDYNDCLMNQVLFEWAMQHLPAEEVEPIAPPVGDMPTGAHALDLSPLEQLVGGVDSRGRFNEIEAAVELQKHLMDPFDMPGMGPGPMI